MPMNPRRQKVIRRLAGRLQNAGLEPDQANAKARRRFRARQKMKAKKLAAKAPATGGGLKVPPKTGGGLKVPEVRAAVEPMKKKAAV